MSGRNAAEVRADRATVLGRFRSGARVTVTRPGKVQPSASPGYGRAAAAYQEEFSKWQGLIDAAATDPSLSPDQRALAVTVLRSRQQLEANGARQQAVDEELQSEKAARQARRRLVQRVVGFKASR